MRTQPIGHIEVVEAMALFAHLHSAEGGPKCRLGEAL